MAKNFRTQVSGAVGLAASIQKRTGIRLSDVQYIKPMELRTNTLNTKFFSDESEDYFQKLTNDVKERGILVPLIAKRNGTLLAGHNRLRVAQDIGLEVVPVQYVQDELTEAQEQAFVINDNLLRRHLSDERRFALYRQLYPNFDDRLATKGRPSKKQPIALSTEKRYDVPFSENTQNKKSSNNETMKRQKGYDVPFSEMSVLTARKIAEDTGQTEAAVKQQIKRMRAKELNQAQDISSDEIDTAMLKKVEKALKPLEDVNDATRREVIKKLKALVKRLSEVKTS
ncbi:MAG: ParB N-terminal domain-containing protein [Candidatus Kapabacteria bacterium]|nr:ParB N-terminal domain-containing protein [Candidatus Kapabacteria bacterium]